MSYGATVYGAREKKNALRRSLKEDVIGFSPRRSLFWRLLHITDKLKKKYIKLSGILGLDFGNKSWAMLKWEILAREI